MSLPEGSRFTQPALLFLALVLCLAHVIPAVAAIELEQPDGSSLVIDQPARRIITLSPHLAELAYAAGAGDRLLATVEYSNFPEAAARLPRIGDAFRFDLERILALEPDLVIAWGSGNPAPALARLEELGLKVWRIEILRPDDIPAALTDIARSAGLDEPAAARQAREKLADLRDVYADRSPLDYFYQVSERPLFTLNGHHLVSQGLAICGGRNIFADEPVIAPQVSMESVIQSDPDVLIAPALPDQANPLDHWNAWTRMKAVRRHATILLPADKISRATTRALNALSFACQELDRLRKAIQEEDQP